MQFLGNNEQPRVEDPIKSLQDRPSPVHVHTCDVR